MFGRAGHDGCSDDEIWKSLSDAIASGAEYNSNEPRSFSRCLPGTRVGLLEKLSMDMNREGEGKMIWLFGESGSGKSSVAHTLADQLQGQDQLAATFFFSRSSTHRSDTKRVLLTLAYQIGLPPSHIPAKELIIKAIRDNPQLLCDDKPRDQRFEKLIKAPLTSLRFNWTTQKKMIVDALDEGGSRNEIKPMLLALGIPIFQYLMYL